MYLLSEFGEDFLKAVIKIYHHKNKNELMRKLFFFTLANKIQILLAYKDFDLRFLKNADKELEIWFKKFDIRK